MQLTVYILLADTYCPGPSSLATADIRPTTMQNYTAFMDTIAYVVEKMKIAFVSKISET